MFKHLLVPLDGSRLAEAALPAAVYLAESLSAVVTLLHVIERNAPQEIHGERHLTDAEEARKYLDEVAARAFPPGGLKVGAGLAKICGAALHLFMVVHEFSTLSGEKAATAKMLPRATTALLDLAEEDAKAYLDRHINELRAAGLTATADVRRGDPVTVIIETAEQRKADLVVLATHGKSGMDAFWSGSAAPNVTSRSVVPLLLVPVATKKPEA